MASVAFGTNRSRWEIVARFNATRPGIREGIAAPIEVTVNIVWLDTEQDLGDLINREEGMSARMTTAISGLQPDD